MKFRANEVIRMKIVVDIEKLEKRLRKVFNVIGSLLMIVALCGAVYLAVILVNFGITIHEIALNSMNMAVNDLRSFYLYALEGVSWVDMASAKYSIYGVIVGSASVLLVLYLGAFVVCWKVFTFTYKIYKNSNIEKPDSTLNGAE